MPTGAGSCSTCSDPHEQVKASIALLVEGKVEVVPDFKNGAYIRATQQYYGRNKIRMTVKITSRTGLKFSSRPLY
jgi:hypothetical protein